MRPSVFGVILGCTTLLGAGCFLPSPPASPQIAESIGQSFEERPIAQLKGFGEIPKAPAPRLRPGFRGSVRVTADFPTIPPNITVLRERSGRPTDTQTRNIAGTLNVPGGAVGANPDGRELSLAWKDEHGVAWMATASERRLDFTDESKPISTLTVSSWPENATAIASAMAFFRDRGVDTKRYGSAYVDPDWAAWWKVENARGRCMSRQTLASIRAISASMAWVDDGLPTLPRNDGASCVPPEFPSRMVVRFSAMQDGQSILHDDGSPYHGATLLVDAATGDVASGWFTVPVDPDRSDYPALTLDEARARMARGGQGGTPNGDVTIDAITFEWTRVDDGRIPRTDYLYPALVGSGSITYPDKTTSPYRIVVPLVK